MLQKLEFWPGGASYQCHYCTLCCQLCRAEERSNKPVDVLVVRVMLVVVIWDFFPLKQSAWNYRQSVLPNTDSKE